MDAITSFVSSGTALVVGIVFLVFVIFGTIVTFVKYRKRVPPNKALFVYGKKARRDQEGLIVGGRIITAGGTWVNPLLEDVGELPLELITMSVKGDGLMTKNGVNIIIDWTAQVKIGNDEKSIRTAGSMFLNKDFQEIRDQVQLTLSGNVRSVISTLSVEGVHRERDQQTTKVRKEVAEEMASMGIEIISFSINDIRDEQGYFEALAAQDIAEVKKNAEIAKAAADEETRKAKAAAELKAREAEIQSLEQIAIKENELAIKQAQLKKKVDTEQADADMAKAMRETELNKDLAERQAAVELMKEQEMTKVAKQAAVRREEELEAEIRKPADAEAYRIEQIAKAQLSESKNQADGSKALAIAEADGNRAKLEATAAGKKADLLAEAEGKEKLAEALNAYEDAALRLTVAQLFIQQMPTMVEALASQFNKIGEVKMIDLGGSSSEGGLLEKFASTAPKALLQFAEVLQATSGIDILSILKGSDKSGSPEFKETKAS